MPQTHEQQTAAGSRTQIVDHINAYLRSGDYSRALSALAEFPKDEQLAELEKQAQEGVNRKAEADQLITESQELFAQQKSGEAIQLLRKAYELDKNNSLARAILANALVEHAQSMVETDWLEAEKLTNQALALNRLHPTARNILNLIVERKKNSSIDDWVAQASRLQSSGDLFAALAWVAEGLAVHPNDPKLLQLQDSIQRDQAARRRQSRRRDLDELRRMQREIEGAADAAAKQALAERIQALAANYWTDGEILSIANALLLRLGMAAQGGANASSRSKGAAVIFHVPRPSGSAPPNLERQLIQPSVATAAEIPPDMPASEQAAPNPRVSVEKLPDPVVSEPVPAEPIPAASIPVATVEPAKEKSSTPAAGKVAAPPAKAKIPKKEVVAKPAIETPPQPKKASPTAPRKMPAASRSSAIIVIPVVAAILIAASFVFVRRHHSAQQASRPAAAPISVPTTSAPVAPSEVPIPAETAPSPAAPQSEVPMPPPIVATAPATTPAKEQLPPVPGPSAGALVVVVGQDAATVFLNGKPQRQLTNAGQLRLPNLAASDYTVRISKAGFQDAPEQKIRLRPGEEAKLTFNLQPQVRLASLSIQGGVAGTTVLVDQAPVGAVQPDGTLLVANINPGDRTIELRKERFKARQFRKHFDAGATVALAAADTAMEVAPGELKITFTPPDASIALVKGDLLKMVSSGVPLSLPAGTYTLTARTAERFTRWGSLEIVAGQSKTFDLSLAPNGMSKWDDPTAWKHEGDSYTRKGGDFALYGVAPTSGTFSFSAMPVKGRALQWVLNYMDARNYILLQVDENNFYRSVIRNGQKSDEIIVPHKLEKKALRALQIRVSPTEIVHQIKQGENWKVLDRWTQPGTNLSAGKFGFYVPGNDQIAISGFAQYGELNVH